VVAQDIKDAVMNAAALWSALALAAPTDGAGWLAEMDASAARTQDAHVVLDVSVFDKRGGEASRTMEVWQKGTHRRLVRLTAPARLAGVSLLLSEDTVHLYLPAYGRARRVIGEQRGDAFLGTDFSVEDLSRITFADAFTAELEGVDGGVVRLLLTPLDPDDHPDAALRVRVREADALPTRIDHLDASGAVTRRVTLGDFREVPVGAPAGDTTRAMAHLMEVEDLESRRRSKAQVTSVALDQGLGDEHFTTTALMRP